MVETTNNCSWNPQDNSRDAGKVCNVVIISHADAEAVPYLDIVVNAVYITRKTTIRLFSSNVV